MGFAAEWLLHQGFTSLFTGFSKRSRESRTLIFRCCQTCSPLGVQGVYSLGGNYRQGCRRKLFLLLRQAIAEAERQRSFRQKSGIQLQDSWVKFQISAHSFSASLPQLYPAEDRIINEATPWPIRGCCAVLSCCCCWAGALWGGARGMSHYSNQLQIFKICIFLALVYYARVYLIFFIFY